MKKGFTVFAYYYLNFDVSKDRDDIFGNSDYFKI